MNLAEDELGALGRGYIRLFANSVKPTKPLVAKIPSLFDISAPEQLAAAPAVATAAVPQDADENEEILAEIKSDEDEEASDELEEAA